MRSPRLAALLAASLSLAFVACGGGSGGPECEDGEDNDSDGLIDGADPSCAAGGATEDADDPTRDCNDGEDNDGDNLIDYPEDPGCDNGQDNDELNSPIPACDDGADNDDDGKTDYPDDPGCSSPLQNTEDDDCPDGVGCPECGNGMDDDGDGDTDYPADVGCQAASDSSERSADPTACSQLPFEPLPETGLVAGVLLAGTSVISSATCGGAGAELAYEIYVEEPVIMVATTDLTGTAFDTILYVRERCGDMTTELGCNDDATPDTRRSTLTEALDPGFYYLIVDGDAAGTSGGFNLKVEFFAGVGTDCTGNPDICVAGTACRTIEGGSNPTCEFPICSDNREDDGDDLTDYPNDPGCESPEDMDEADICDTDPANAACPACWNGMDDDGDNLTDFLMDPDCESASQLVEGCATEADPIGTIVGPVTTGSTVGLTNDFDAMCTSSAGPDKVFLLNLPAAATTLQIDTIGTSFDTALMVKSSDCGATDLACDDDGAGVQSMITQADFSGGTVPAGSYVIIVDGYGSPTGTSGSFTLNVHGTVGSGAACVGTLFESGAFSCASGEYCNGTICVPSPCNDAVDDDGDGDGTNFPGDPGCTSISDSSEEDDCPSGPSCPRCANDVDDDVPADGLIDYPLDPNCTSASANDETGCASASDAYLPITGPLTTGNIATTNGNDFDPSCHASSGRDLAFELDVPFALERLYLDTNGSGTVGSGFNTTLSMKSNGCNAGATEVFCDTNSGDDGIDAYKALGTVAPGRYAVIVDSAAATTGTFVLNTRGVIAVGGACSPALEASGLFVCNATSHCSGAAGSETCVPFACSDGNDNDVPTDGKGDANDPGCLSGADDSEADPGTVPQCADAGDNDSDTLNNYPNDPGCLRASDTLELTCADPSSVTEITTAHTYASTAGTGADYTAGCVANSSGSPEKVFSLTVPGTMSTLRFNAELPLATGSSYDKVMYVRKDQCATDITGGCADYSDFTLTNAAPGTYFVFVDGYNTASGNFHLLVKGTIASGAVCDPAQIQSGMFACASGTSCIGNVCQ